jgi:hypothetical protein
MFISSPSSKFVLATLAVAAIVASSLPKQAQADKTGNIVGGIVGGVIGAAIIKGIADSAKAATQQPQRPSGSSSSTQRKRNDGEDGGEAKAARRTPDERASDARNHAAAEAERNEIRRTEQLERGRDVALAIEQFRELLEFLHRDLRSTGANGTNVKASFNINQVTEGEIRRAVDAAFKTARLSEFERFSGELWTRDRLTVRILDTSRRQLGEFFRGVGVKGVSMSDLEQIFDQSAKQVYSHAMQISEMVGVSHSFDRFIRTIYEHSDRADESLSTIGADGRYERIVASYVDSVPREEFLGGGTALAADPTGLERQFLFRFRARRVLYDCMAARYADVISQNRGPTLETNVRPDTTRPSIIRAASGDTAAREQVWSRMGTFVETSCRDPLGNVLTDAKDNRLQPRPARWDSTGGDAAFSGGRSPIHGIVNQPQR